VANGVQKRAGVTATFNFFPALSKEKKEKKKKSCLLLPETTGHARQTEDSTT
jgi:hypothetical protein